MGWRKSEEGEPDGHWRETDTARALVHLIQSPAGAVLASLQPHCPGSSPGGPLLLDLETPL